MTGGQCRSDDKNNGAGPCAGVKVLDLSTMVSGPMCGRILGDLGADVIKLEGNGGDMIRTMPPIYRGMSGYFMQMNRNKRGVAIDLKTAQGRALARELVMQADVFIENFRPGVAARLGLDYTLAATTQRPAGLRLDQRRRRRRALCRSAHL